VTAGTSVLAVITDLMFESRVREQTRALGYEFASAETTAAVRDALVAAPSLVVLDLHVTGVDWPQVVSMAKEAGVPVLAFGRHTEAQLLASAREAGCDRVVPRSTLVEEMPQLIRELIGVGS
jgi:DNA-binding response OmpR family regulator